MEILNKIKNKYYENDSYILFLIISFFLGYIIHHTDRDLSRNSGFIFSSYQTIMPFLHILYGFLIGIFLYPRNYDIENKNYKRILIEKYGKIGNIISFMIKYRTYIGLFLYILYTLRNIIKHPYTLKKKMEKCKIGKNYIINSSISRQQLQILIGILISIIYFKDNPDHSLHNNKIIILNIIIFITTFQSIIKIIITKKNTKQRENFLKCIKDKKIFYDDNWWKDFF